MFLNGPRAQIEVSSHLYLTFESCQESRRRNHAIL